jgi:small-conductance mechanosensitive channel/CRP-like cAMP-binding protein
VTPDLIWILPLMAVLGLVLRAVSAGDRYRIRYSLGLCAASLVLWGAYRLLEAPWMLEAAWALAELAGVHLVAILLFHILLRRWRPPEIAADLAIGAAYILIFFALLSRVGVNITGLIATSAVATAVIGFALQDTLANLAGGLTLEFERSVLQGDWLETERGIGCVRAVRLRHTAIETPDGDTILIPNSVLMKSMVKVVGRLPGQAPAGVRHRKLVTFALSYHHDPLSVIDAVDQAISGAQIDGVLAEPRPRCVIVQYHPQHVDYGVLVWLSRPAMEYVDVSVVRSRIHLALQRLGAPLTPISNVVELHHAGGPGDDASARLDAVRLAEIFRALSEEEAHRLALRLRPMSYAPGERILKQGDSGDSLFLLTHGKAAVSISAGGGLRRDVAQLGPGEFFGEMSLLTGEPRTATVTSLDRVQCYQVAKEDLTDLLAARPELAVKFSETLERRLEGLGEARALLDEDAARQEAGARRGDLLSRIQRWFGLFG